MNKNREVEMNNLGQNRLFKIGGLGRRIHVNLIEIWGQILKGSAIQAKLPKLLKCTAFLKAELT